MTGHAPNDYKSDLKPVWCAGCGDFGVLNSLYRTLADIGCEPHQTVVVSGIGCSSRLPGYVETYGFNSLHGRALPIATGIKIASPELTVIAVGGDGDGIAIGGNHFLHAARRNVDIAYIMMDNEIYGLTKGQAAPTTPTGDATKSTVYGSPEAGVDPCVLALVRRNVGRARILRRREGHHRAHESRGTASRLRFPQHPLALRHLARRRADTTSCARRLARSRRITIEPAARQRCDGRTSTTN